MSYAQDDEFDNAKMKIILANSMNELNQTIAIDAVENGNLYMFGHSIDVLSIARLNKEQLRILRNTAYAKYGYIFKSEDLLEHFKKYTWYVSKYDDSVQVGKLMSHLEKQLIKCIESFDNMGKTKKRLTESDIRAGWHLCPSVPAGYCERFYFYKNNKFRYVYSQMRELPIIKSISGNYRIEGDILILTADTKNIFEHGEKIDYSGAFGFQWESVKSKKEKISSPVEFKLPISGFYSGSNVYDSGKKILKIGGIEWYIFGENPEYKENNDEYNEGA
jgi:hypothetical protein